MKKLFALALTVMMLASMATIVFAEGTSTTTLMLNVPAASYKLNVPDTVEIPFGQTEAEIGNISVTDGKNFASNKNLKVTVTYDAFSSQTSDITVPFTLSYASRRDEADGMRPFTHVLESGRFVYFCGKDDGTINSNAYEYDDGYGSLEEDYLVVNLLAKDLNKAPAGEYTATITFTAEVVVES